MKYQIIQLYLSPKRPAVYSYTPGMRVRLDDGDATLAQQWLNWFKKHFEEFPSAEPLAAKVGVPMVSRSVVVMYQQDGTHPWERIYVSPVLPDAMPYVTQMGNYAVNQTGGAYEGIAPGQPPKGDLTS